jgi:YbbR domain-containing protein
MNRLGLKISCIVVSVVIWMQVASTAEVEKTARLAVSIEGLREGLTVAGSEIPPTVSVDLTGSKLRLLAHRYFNHYVGEIKINLADQGPGPAFWIDPSAADVFTDLQPPTALQAGAFEIRVDTVITRLVPVALASRGNLSPEFGFLTPPTLDPDTVVTGPARFFPERFSVRTEPVDFTRISASGEQEVGLLSPHEFLRLATRQVEVGLRIGRVEERTLANVPVVPLVDAGRPPVGISPPVADIMVRGVADSVSRLTADRLSVVVPVNDLPEGVYDMAGQVEHPAWLTLIGMDPASFRVIVGNPTFAPDSTGLEAPEAGPDE